MATNIYEFKWKVYAPIFPGCANDGTERYLAKCFDEAYQKLLKNLKPWFEEAKRTRKKLDWEVFSANRVMSDVR